MGCQRITGFILCCLFFLERVYGVGTSQITMDETTLRYDNILISISNEIDQSKELIDNIKTLFTAASRILTNATTIKEMHKDVGRSFGKIYILLPDTWNTSDLFQNVTPANSFQRHRVADIIIHNEAGNPHTHQPDGCRKQGKAMTYPKKFIDGINFEITNADKIVVQEWAKFRWGVYSETPRDATNQFFVDKNGNIRLHACSTEIKGEVKSSGNIRCNFNNTANKFPKRCRFEPYKDNNTSNYSLMSYAQVKSIVMFCFMGNHVRETNTLQNKECGHESIWSIMEMHDDFYGRFPDPVEYYPPEFVLIQKPKQKDLYFQIIVDCSGSMEGDPMNNMIYSLTNLIRSINSTNTQLKIGIVAFRSFPETILEPTYYSYQTREQFLDAIYSLVAGGGTALSDGVVQAFEDIGGNLYEPDKFDKDAIFLVVSDGEENTGMYSLRYIIPIFENISMLQINTISYGTDASEKLRSLGKKTGGRDYAVDPSKNNEILSSLIKILNARTNEDQEVFTIANEALTSPANNSNLIWQGFIDAGVGESTVFYFTFPNTIPQLQVKSPKGKLYNRSSGPDVYVEHGDKLVIRIPNIAEPGNWTVSLVNSLFRTARSTIISNISRGEIMLISKQIAKPPLKVVDISSYMSDDILKMASTNRILVHVWVGRDYQPILGANVVLNIKQIGNPKLLNIVLRDNGIGPDTIEDDGFYSAYIVARMFQQEGFYKINTKVISSSDQSDSNGFSFERTEHVGDLRIYPASPGSPMTKIPPGRVTDLQVKILDGNEKTVLLEWTAPGAEGDQGNVLNYVIRVDSKPKIDYVRIQCYSYEIITPNWIPKSPYEHEQVLLKIRRSINCQSNVFVVFFFVQAHGPHGLAAPMSFPASVSFTKPNLPSGIKFSASKP